ncbi:MAG: hypothetical protein ACOC93_03105, partial [Planctomycetota bacterium]
MHIRMPWIISLLLVLLAAPAGSARASQKDPTGPQGEYARYRLKLLDAGEGDQPLLVDLHARDGKPLTGWAHVGTDVGYIRSHGLQREDDLLRGELFVEVGPLQYTCDLSARVVDGQLVGSYAGRRGITGAVGGRTGGATGRLAPAAEGDDLHVELSLW